ncbi:MAG: VCBS repeat-containing protein [Chloroflexi bacterium]|nr:VCBS repeat-containing protein [Chloroflexota bacterium]
MRLFSSRTNAFQDYDNDGRPDMLWGEGGNTRDLRLRWRTALLHNEGDGRFAEQTSVLRADLSRYNKGGGAAFGDYDNDGDLDLFVPVIREGSTFELTSGVLLRNDRGVFGEVSAAAGLTAQESSDHSVWLDYDRDGYLDLYVENTGERNNTLYRNRGDGTFADVTEEAGLGAAFRGTLGGLAVGDFDGDGWPDLYLSATSAPKRLWLNDQQGHFRDASTRALATSGENLGVAAGDIDNDGDLDIFQAAGTFEAERSVMLLNLGGGKFLDYTEAVGLAALTATALTAVGLADIDNDGDLDLLTLPSPFLYLNNGDGTFVDETTRSGITGGGISMSFGDYDQDGFLDVWSSEGRLYRNNGNNNHWLRVELAGTQSNRGGIGARLVVEAGDLRQMREMLGGRGLAQDEQAIHFGLGPRIQVERLEIRWPSGQMDVLKDIPADRQIRVFEGREDYHLVQPTAWEEAPPDTLVAGSVVELNIAVRPALFEPGAEIAQVTADLSSFVGAEAVPLEPAGNGTWKVEGVPISVTGPNGLHPLHVMIDQQTSLGPYWTQLSRNVAVLPGEDLVVFGDVLHEQWTLTGDTEVNLDPQESTVVFSGSSSLALKTPSFWKVVYLPAEPVERLGYQVLRFAFHPGDVTVPRDRSFRVFVNSEPIILLGQGQTLVDMEVKGWQIVEVPLDSLKTRDPITALSFQGNLEGTFYLDNIRLVAAPPPPITVVEEERTAVLPQTFSLAQNYPNPFNSETVIHFALPESGEVELSVYNIAGQEVAVLVQGRREAGIYVVRWDGRDDMGRELASGVYLYRLRAGERMETRKMVLVR